MSSQSSLTGNILGAIGAGVGAFFGGPVGAAQGYAIGSGIGNAIDPPKGPTIEGPRLADKSIQVSTYGAMLPRFYGTIGVSGNITWLENNQLKETVRKKKQGGKGGGSTATTKIYTYSATFILSLGLGPIAGVRRIWCGDKLIYNAGSDDLETIIASNQAASGFRIYLGTDDQLPDPRYEADVGVGNASAFRGEAYIAFYDFQLTDFANSLQAAQFKVEVVTAQDEVPARWINANGFIADTGVSDGEYPYYYSGALVSTWQHLISSDQLIRRVRNLAGHVVQQVTINYPYNAATFGIANDPDSHFINGGRLNGSDGLIFFYPIPFYAFPSTGRAWGHAVRIGDFLFVAAYRSGSFPHAVFKYSLAAGNAADYWLSDTAATGGNESVIATDGEYLYVLRNQSPIRITVIDPEDMSEVKVISGGSVASYSAASQFSVHDGYISTFSAANARLGRISGTSVVNVSNLTDRTSGNGPAGAVVALDDNLIWTDRGVFQANFTPNELVDLADIIQSEVVLSSMLTPLDLDVSLLTDQVRGYRVSGGSIRSALEPLQGAFPFDVIQSGYQLKCVPRGQSSVLDVSWEDLVTNGSQDIVEILKESREMDSQLPVRTNIKYMDAAREYAIAEQYSERPNTQAINRVDREFPIVITADEAAKVADVLNNLPWQERTTAQTSLPPTMLALEPSDVITLTTPFATYEYRIADSRYTANGSIDIQVRTNNAAIYTSSAEGSEGVPPVGTIPLQGPTLWVPMDIPVVDETVQNSPGFGSVATGYTSGWSGAVAFRTVDSGQTWSEIQGYTGLPTIGYARTALAANTGHVIQKTSLVIDLLSGELESITRDQMIAGQNYVAYGADGRWEIIRFQNATLQGDGSYLVSDFVRGDKGTEWATGLHAAGDYFVLLDDPDNAFIDMAVGSIGIDSMYRGVTNGANIDSASDVPFTYQGVNLEPLSPVTANGVRDISGNFTGSFYRRSRLSSSWWSTGVPAPIGETTESYEIDVMSGSTVKRTITASTPSFSYSAANQVTDFGSTQSAITFRIYQLSEIVGRGYVLETTL